MIVLRFLSGLALLVLGRQFYWVFVGATGFLLGLELAARFLHGVPEILLIVIALLAGLGGAALAIVFQRIAIGLAGFAAGGLVVANLLDELGVQSAPTLFVVFIIGGVLGALFVLVLFDWALIVLSSITGAAILARIPHLFPAATFILFLILLAIGAAIQVSWFLHERQPG